MPIDLAGVCTGDGPCVTAPIGLKKNWVTDVQGLPLYIRAIAQALLRSGHDEQDAIKLAVGVVHNWASGQGKVTAATRARAAAALAEWETKRARSRVSHDHTGGRTMAIELAGNRMLPNEAAVRKAARNLHKLPAPLRKVAKRRLAMRAKQLGITLTGPAGRAVTLAMPATDRADAKTSYPGTDKFPISSQADFTKAWNLRGNSTLPKAKVEAWLRGVAAKNSYTIPDDGK